MLNRSLPSAPEAEATILGAILLDNENVTQAVEMLEPSDFYSPSNRSIFSAMVELYQERKPIDHVTLSEMVGRDDPGGITGPEIAGMAFGLPMFTDIGEYCETVRKKSYLRRLIRDCGQITSAAMDGSESPEHILLDAQTKINNLCLESAALAENDGFISLKQVIHHDVLPSLDKLRTGQRVKISTGFPGIDEAIGGGLSTSDVMLLAGLPASGKSALALQMGYQIAAQGVPTAFLAGEMTNCENVYRLLSQISRTTNINSLTRIADDEHKILVQWAERIQDVPLYLDHRTSDVQTLAARMRSLTRRYGLKVLVIDYIQLLKLQRVTDKLKRSERLAEASQEIKRLANELDLAVIAVAQFNREGAKSGQPSMHDLEGSGQLEKDPSLIFIIDRDEYEREKVTLRIVKGRNTGPCSIQGLFQGRCVRFEI